MDRVDDLLRDYFRPGAPPRGLVRRALRAAPRRPAALPRLMVEATPRGVTRLGARGAVRPATAPAARRWAARAAREVAEYLAGRRTFFTVPLDLAGLGPFQARVLAATRRIPYGEVVSYATLARRVGHPRAARAVGGALARNPVPLLIPCHRVVRGDGTWGRYALGDGLKTRLLALERTTPTLVGCTTTRIVCRRGCHHERRVAEGRRVAFAAVADARGVGYRPCRVCRAV